MIVVHGIFSQLQPAVASSPSLNAIETHRIKKKEYHLLLEQNTELYCFRKVGVVKIRCIK